VDTAGWSCAFLSDAEESTQDPTLVEADEHSTYDTAWVALLRDPVCAEQLRFLVPFLLASVAKPLMEVGQDDALIRFSQHDVALLALLKAPDPI